MGYLIRDSNTKASFSFSPVKLKVYRAEEEVDEPVETVIEQEEEVIPEEAQGQSTEQAPTGDSEVEELDPMEQEEAAKQEAIANQEEEDDDVWMDGAECVPDMDNQCGPGMYCSFETSTCVPDENQEEAQARADQEAAEAKAKAEKEAAEAKAKADQEAANAAKKNTTSSKKSGGGGGGGGRGPYMSKNDKLWNKKLKSKSKKTSATVVGKKSNVGIRIVGVLASLGVAYGAYRTINK